MNKIQQLAKVKADLEARKDIPLIHSPQDVVFGDGNPDAEIMFIGEAAGYHESVQRKPFVGQAGKLLDKVLEENGIKRAEVYISNIVKTRPPENRDPEPAEIEAFAPYLDQEIEIINPKMIVTLGRFSMGKFIPDVKISQVHGQARYVDWKGREILVIPMYHPAAALRAGAMMKMFKEDFQKIPGLLKGNAPTEKKAEPEEIEKPAIKQLEIF